jgi:GDPmannose 4,6-dehydratase
MRILSGQSNRKALVIGVNGQDGSYMAEALLAAGVETIGIGRQEISRHVPVDALFSYYQLDVTNEAALAAYITEVRPDRIYHLAAVHGASGFFYEDKWQDVLHVNLASVHVCLEYMRACNPEARLLYASSLKAFGLQPPQTISEETVRLSTCLYSITKNAATDLISYYRVRHGARSTILYLLNHESPRRQSHFVLPRICGFLASALRGEKADGQIASLDFACDWGSSAEFMQLGARLLEAEPNQDYVMGTGKTWIGRDFVEHLFAEVGLNWRDHLVVRNAPGSDPVHLYQADISRLIETIGHGPRMSAIDVAHWIMAENHGITAERRSG